MKTSFEYVFIIGITEQEDQEESGKLLNLIRHKKAKNYLYMCVVDKMSIS